MPSQGPGDRYDVQFTKATQHGAPAVENGHPGIAAKSEQAAPAAVSVANAAAAQLIAVGEEAVIIMGGVVDVAVADLPVGADDGDPLWIAEADNSLHLDEDDAVAASLVTGLVGSNNAIRWTADEPGEAGEDIRVALVDPAANSQALAVDVDGDDITVSLATDGAGAIVSTAAQVIAAVNEHDTASQLVTAANAGVSNGTGVVTAVGLTPLAGGADEDAGLIKFGRISSIDDTTDIAQVNLDRKDTF